MYVCIYRLLEHCRVGNITDAIVNNAGILRDRSFGRMTDTDWGNMLFAISALFTNTSCPHFVSLCQVNWD